MLTHPLLPKLKALKLTGMLNTMEARTELARTTDLSATEFLALLLDDEIDRRRQATLRRQEKAAGFESSRRLSQFDFSIVPTLDRRLVLEMSSCQFIVRHENWLIHGPSGVGKSHLAAAIGYEAIRQGMTVQSVSTHQLVVDLIASRSDGTHAKRMNRLAALDLLILDDFGLRTHSPSGAEELYELIRRRYEHGSILLTSNRTPTEWPAVFGDELLASAALDRLTHHAHVTCIKEKSQRQEDRKEIERLDAALSAEPDKTPPKRNVTVEESDIASFAEPSKKPAKRNVTVDKEAGHASGA
jgi:DNA replication protein DnaC